MSVDSPRNVSRDHRNITVHFFPQDFQDADPVGSRQIPVKEGSGRMSRFLLALRTSYRC